MTGDKYAILIVEDSKTILLLLQRLLEGVSNCTVYTAADAPTALQHSREHDLDLILLDMLLPIMNGFEVAQAIRAMEGKEKTPIVAITTFGNEPEWREKSLAAGCNECLDKASFLSNPSANLQALLTKYIGV